MMAAADLALLIQERIRHYFQTRDIARRHDGSEILRAREPHVGSPLVNLVTACIEVIRVNNGEDGLSLQLVGRVPQ